MGEVPRLLDAHLAEYGLTREQFAARASELYRITEAEALRVFGPEDDYPVCVITAARHIFGLDEDELRTLQEAAVSDMMKLLEANRRAQSI